VRLIWWKAYGKSLHKLNQPDKLKVQKFINDWIPTNKRLHRYCSDHSCKCSSRGTEVEDEDHIIRCLTQGRQKIRTEWLTALKEFLSSSHTLAPNKTSILTNMTRWMEPTMATNSSYKSKIDREATKRAELLQHRIGWRQFIRGRTPIQWDNIISTHLDQQGIKSISAERWGATLIEINWRFVLSMWALRNDVQHGKDSIDKTKSKKQKLIEELTKMIRTCQAHK
jgi:hypothetical protein